MTWHIIKLSLLNGLLALLIISCQEKAKEYFNQGYIHTFYHPDSAKNYLVLDSTKHFLPAPDDSKGVFVLVDSNRVAYTQKGLLSAAYKKYSLSIGYYDFMYNALNQRRVFSSNAIIGCKFHLDSLIVNAYQKKGTRDLLKTYFEKVEEVVYRLKMPLESEQKFTILYFMFLNNYEIVFDDYEGSFYIKPFKQIKSTV
ncbi:hypothetical protein [Spirosoma gilvum]